MLNVMLRDLSCRPWEWLKVLEHVNYLIQQRSLWPLMEETGARGLGIRLCMACGKDGESLS